MPWLLDSPGAATIATPRSTRRPAHRPRPRPGRTWTPGPRSTGASPPASGTEIHVGGGVLRVSGEPPPAVRRHRGPAVADVLGPGGQVSRALRPSATETTNRLAQTGEVISLVTSDRESGVQAIDFRRSGTRTSVTPWFAAEGRGDVDAPARPTERNLTAVGRPRRRVFGFRGRRELDERFTVDLFDEDVAVALERHLVAVR